MSLVSFSNPSDTEVLEKVSKNNCQVHFIDKGKVFQNMTETLYERKVKIILEKEEVLQRVIFVKKGIQWLFKSVETIS